MMRKAKSLNLIFYLQANLSISRSLSRGSRIPEQPKSFKLVTVASLDVEWRGSGGLAMSMNEHWLYIQTSSSIFSCIFHSHPDQTASGKAQYTIKIIQPHAHKEKYKWIFITNLCIFPCCRRIISVSGRDGNNSDMLGMATGWHTAYIMNWVLTSSK